jgi:hypothetical protein
LLKWHSLHGLWEILQWRVRWKVREGKLNSVCTSAFKFLSFLLYDLQDEVSMAGAPCIKDLA